MTPGRLEPEMQLFDVSRTTQQQCQACGATRDPGEPKATACSYDRDLAFGFLTNYRRPHQCLNRIDPATAPFPEGY